MDQKNFSNPSGRKRIENIMIKEPKLNMDALYSEDDKSFVFIATRKWFQTMSSWVIEQFLRAMIPKSA